MNYNVDYQDEDQMSTFSIDSPKKANWAIKKIKEERERRDIFLSAAECEIDSLSVLIAEEKNSCDRKTQFLMYKLNDYLDTVPAKETKTMRKIKLPNGELIRSLPKSDYCKDDKTFLAYLQENAPDYVETKPSAKWGEFKKLLEINGDSVVRTDTGEIIDCITVTENPASFDVK